MHINREYSIIRITFDPIIIAMVTGRHNSAKLVKLNKHIMKIVDHEIMKHQNIKA